jgi:hypothetical protein
VGKAEGCLGLGSTQSRDHFPAAENVVTAVPGVDGRRFRLEGALRQINGTCGAHSLAEVYAFLTL